MPTISGRNARTRETVTFVFVAVCATANACGRTPAASVFNAAMRFAEIQKRIEGSNAVNLAGAS